MSARFPPPPPLGNDPDAALRALFALDDATPDDGPAFTRAIMRKVERAQALRQGATHLALGLAGTVAVWLALTLDPAQAAAIWQTTASSFAPLAPAAQEGGAAHWAGPAGLLAALFAGWAWAQRA
jgi:hypothetical protein